MTCHHAKRWYAKYINLLFHVRKLLAIYSVVYRVIVVGLKKWWTYPTFRARSRRNDYTC